MSMWEWEKCRWLVKFICVSVCMYRVIGLSDFWEYNNIEHALHGVKRTLYYAHLSVSRLVVVLNNSFEAWHEHVKSTRTNIQLPIWNVLFVSTCVYFIYLLYVESMVWVQDSAEIMYELHNNSMSFWLWLGRNFLWAFHRNKWPGECYYDDGYFFSNVLQAKFLWLAGLNFRFSNKACIHNTTTIIFMIIIIMITYVLNVKRFYEIHDHFLIILVPFSSI